MPIDSLKKYGLRGYTAKLGETGVSSKIVGSTSFGWGLCMKPTEKMACTIQQDLPGMSKADIEYKNNKCEIKDGWYQKRCEEIDGYWLNNQCYVR